jgi:hypothetical protein
MKMIFDPMAKKLIGFGPEKSRKLRKNLDVFFQGMVSFPLYFPGTAFYKCIQVLLLVLYRETYTS